MSTFWQTVISAALTALVAGRVAVTRTGRLRKDIRENIDLLVLRSSKAVHKESPPVAR